MSDRTKNRLLFSVILAVAAVFRLYGLGGAAFRGDTIHFWRLCHVDITGWQIVQHWMELRIGQLPFPLAFTKFFIDLFHLPPTDFNIRLPMALAGLATVPVMWHVGRRLGGRWAAVLAALLMALHPFQIQMSVEAYFYATVILGAALMFGAFLDALVALRDRTALGAMTHVAAAGGLFLVAYSQITGWLTAFCLGVAYLVVLFKRSKVDAATRRDLWISLGALGVAFAPLLFFSWGLPFNFGKLFDTQEKQAAAKALAVLGGTPLELLGRTVTSFGWGDTLLRTAFTALILAVAGWAAVADRERRIALRWTMGLFGASFLLFLLGRPLISATYESRYLTGLIPLYVAMLAVGLAALPGLLRGTPLNKGRWPVFIGVALAAAAVGLLVKPAWAVNRQDGHPTPYRKITRWANENLRPGTPVLVDRWFEPWNEMVPYPSSNAVYTFTIPNEPVDVFISHGWRRSAQEFFMRHPDGVYLEVAKSYADVAGVGPWEWPRKFFAHHVALTNDAGFYLREVGLAARGDYFADNTNRLVVEAFFNKAEDTMRLMRAAGVSVYTYYGPGWKFEKSGPMQGLRQLSDPQGRPVREFRDWRVLEDSAQLDVVNVSTSPVLAMVELRGTAFGGAKSVQVSPEIKHTFADWQQAYRLSAWQIGPLSIMPGVNVLTLSDPLWSLSQNPLLVSEIRVVPVQGEAGQKVMMPSPTGAAETGR